MKSWYLGLLFSSLLLSISTFSHSTTISYSGYTYDSETNSVFGGGLEWATWGPSNSYGPWDLYSNLFPREDGWRIATSDEVISLVQAFSPFSITDALGSTGEFTYSTPYAEGDDGFDKLIDIMGNSFDNIISTDSSVDDDVFPAQSGSVFAHTNDQGELTFGYFSAFSDNLYPLGTADGSPSYSPSQVMMDLQVDWISPAATPVTYDDFLNFDLANYDASDKDLAVASLLAQVQDFTYTYDAFSLAFVRDIHTVPELSASMAPAALLLLGSMVCLGTERRRRQKLL